jgi:V/A-type H+-transporting ATPase subunit E
MARKRKDKDAASIGDAAPFVDEIHRQTDEEVEKALSRAKRTADSRLDEARKRAHEETERILDAARDRAELERRRILSDLSLEMKKITLKARGELVQDVLGQVRARVERTRGTPEYRDMLKAFVIEGIQALDRDAVQVSVSSADRATANDAFFTEVAAACGRPVKIAPQADLGDTAMGAIVRAADGSVLFDNTIEARMERMTDDLQLIVSKEVFAEESRKP